jgi:hypothetical protein
MRGRLRYRPKGAVRGGRRGSVGRFQRLRCGKPHSFGSPDLDIEITGFEPTEIDALMGDLVDPEQDPFDQLPEIAKVAGGGFVGEPTVRFGTAAVQTPAFESRIPAPLPASTQAPVINGPMSQPAFRGLTGIGQ